MDFTQKQQALMLKYSRLNLNDNFNLVVMADELETRGPIEWLDKDHDKPAYREFLSNLITKYAKQFTVRHQLDNRVDTISNQVANYFEPKAKLVYAATTIKNSNADNPRINHSIPASDDLIINIALDPKTGQALVSVSADFCTEQLYALDPDSGYLNDWFEFYYRRLNLYLNDPQASTGRKSLTVLAKILFTKNPGLKTADSPAELAKNDFSPAMLNLLTHLKLSDRNTENLLMPLDVLKFLHALRNDEPIDTKIMNAFAMDAQGTTNEEEIGIMKNLATKMNLNQAVEYLRPESDKYAEVTKMLNTDNDFKDRHEILHIYEIKQPQHQANFSSHKTLLHGTKNKSVLSLIKYGFLDDDQLEALENEAGHSVHNDTGKGLGNGFYFADPKQAYKSSNYTDDYNNQHGFMFLCDVGFNNLTKSMHWTQSWDEDSDLRLGSGVGSGDRDEYVAVHSNQIDMQYLIEFQNKNDY